MSKPNDKSGWRTVIVIGLAVLLLLLGGYLLSTGPAALLTQNGYMSANTLLTVYRPITWAGKQSPTFNRAILWYIKLWTGAP